MLIGIEFVFAVAALLHFSGSASAFCPHIRATRASFPRRAVPALRAHNEFDVWWAERRVSNRVGGAPGAQTQVLDALPLDVPSLTLVLEEFVESDYARQVCSCCNLQPTDYGCIGGMCADRREHAHTTRTPRAHQANTTCTPCAPRARFESVRLTDAKVVVKMKPTLNQVEGLKDRLAKYLRARMPEVVEIHAVLRDGVDIY